MKKNGRTGMMTLIGALLCAAVLSGCGTEMDPRLKAIQGRWVDVNSDATLDITGAFFVYSSGAWSERYPFILSKAGNRTVLEPPQGKDFGPLSEITLETDGSLTAQEMVLDAEGHQYRFVREADKAAELEIRDLSEDLPKQIESTEIRSFSLSFYKDYDGQYDLDDFWPRGHYSWTIDKNDSGWQMELNVFGESYMILQFSAEPDEAWMTGLARLLGDAGVTQNNGYYHKNNAHRHGWSLWVEYDSGEKLSLRAEGDAAANCVFDLPALMEYARTQGVKFH